MCTSKYSLIKLKLMMTPTSVDYYGLFWNYMSFQIILKNNICSHFVVDNLKKISQFQLGGLRLAVIFSNYSLRVSLTAVLNCIFIHFYGKKVFKCGYSHSDQATET